MMTSLGGALGRRRRLLGQDSHSPSLPPPTDGLQPMDEPSGDADRQNLADTRIEPAPDPLEPPDPPEPEAAEPEAEPPAQTAEAEAPAQIAEPEAPAQTAEPEAPAQPEAPAAPPADPSVPAPAHAATTPPAPRADPPPPGFGQLPTPVQPPRLPDDFKATPQGADWFVGTGQPLPERDAVPDVPIAPRPPDLRPYLFAAVGVALLAGCAGIALISWLLG